MERSLLELIAAERNPELRKVLECYRGAQIELQEAARKLDKLGRYSWALAAETRASDIEWLVQNYMKHEGGRVLAMRDDVPFDERPTNPRGYPAHTGLNELADLLEPEPSIVVDQTAHSEHAVFDTDRAPPFSAIERRQRWLNFALNVAVFIVLALAMYAVAKSRP